MINFILLKTKFIKFNKYNIRVIKKFKNFIFLIQLFPKKAGFKEELN